MGKKKVLFGRPGDQEFDPSKYVKFATIRNLNSEDPLFYGGLRLGVYSSRLLYAVQRDTNTVIYTRAWNSQEHSFGINTELADPYDAYIDLYYDLDFQPNLTGLITSRTNSRYYEFDLTKFPDFTYISLRYQSVPLFDLSVTTKLATFRLLNHRVGINIVVQNPIPTFTTFYLNNGSGTNIFPDWSLTPNIISFHCYKFSGDIGYVNVLTKMHTIYIGLSGAMASQDMSNCTNLYYFRIRGAGTPELTSFSGALTDWNSEDCTGYIGGSPILDVADKPNFKYFKVRGSTTNSLDPSGLTTAFKTFNCSKRTYDHEPLLQKIYDLGTTDGRYTKANQDDYTETEQLLVDELKLRGWIFNSI